MKIYTKKGDAGKTSLIGGTRVPKHHLRVEAYGTVDELNVVIGLLIDQLNTKHEIEILRIIQDRLFITGSNLAADPEKSKMTLPQLSTEDIEMLEKEIDIMDAALPPLKNFILPGGHPAVSFSHLARVVCRRAERIVSQLAENESLNPDIIIYLNRLSDYFFMLSRWNAHILNVEETAWHTRS
ncbi:MAG: cob(I)yrinic acid a,c-diamide adenosyltransferase [Chitinophagales bacterium]|nr:cob(I)yrinic acid a,c-diamide adenosyltransferase [Bacteroidota bacterium]MBP7400073.1 cob(I)yrinic acid a,c-diamide adenosyltransferase [Chitinophagales bacterium]MBK8487970.1 cob(I)yrinic acid a,c-diamide adenosyltransferase [Bacteroidota bacterium]MBK8682272.1 cob(I)yrinic acid a,c-diamide adenosyltransferase [Bacteroidota bacterium]MBP8753762.1 cob(I)yrinic acid a,c-diamide adenosyltransferase [Chitinophagales bacterium]